MIHSNYTLNSHYLESALVLLCFISNSQAARLTFFAPVKVNPVGWGGVQQVHLTIQGALTTAVLSDIMTLQMLIFFGGVGECYHPW